MKIGIQVDFLIQKKLENSSNHYPIWNGNKCLKCCYVIGDSTPVEFSGTFIEIKNLITKL